MKQIYAPYIRVNGRRIEIFKELPIYEFGDSILKDVLILQSDCAINYVGKEIQFTYYWDRLYIEDIDEKFDESEYKYGYKSPLDWFRGTKKPYIKGWVKRESTRDLSVTTNYYKLIERK